MKENMDQSGLQQLGVWLIGEFGELLVNGQTVEMDDTPIQVSESEAIETIANVMNRYKNQNDTIIQHCLIALSKLTVRFESKKSEIRLLIQPFTENSNIEIQQRSCEFLKLFDDSWDKHRLGIFEPMPFQGNENMLVDQTERAIKGDGEGDDEEEDELPKTRIAPSAKETAQQQEDEYDSPGDAGHALDEIFGDIGSGTITKDGVIDFDPLADIFGPGPTEEKKQSTSIVNDIDDIFGGGPAPSQNTGLDMFGGGSSFGNIDNDLFGSSTPPAPKKLTYPVFSDGNVDITFTFERDSSNKSLHKIIARKKYLPQRHYDV